MIENRLYESNLIVPELQWLSHPIRETVWRPPRAGQFTVLDARDESWARPLGLGEVISFKQFVDEMTERFNQAITEMLCIPTEQLTFGGGRYSGTVRYPRQ